MAETFWLQQPATALPFRARIVDSVPPPLRRRIVCQPGAETVVWQLDWERLADDERAWLEGGDDLPALAICWLTRAAALLRVCRANGHVAALLEVHSERLFPLAVSDLLGVMGQDAWRAEAQVALVWGCAHEALLRPRLPRQPLPCRGAVFPCADGLNTGWWALPQERLAITAAAGHVPPL